MKNRNALKHGYAMNGNVRPEFTAWNNLKERCNNPKVKNYGDYGGRGITVCDRWQKFQNFIDDMGDRPTSKHSIERINNNKGYSPENCKWATKKEQLDNRRDQYNAIYLTLDGITKPIKQWAKDTNMNISTLKTRYHRGWSDKDCLTRKVSH